MCQQWLSVAGLALDIVGFLLIAFEWRHMLLREHDKRMFELSLFLKPTKATQNDPVYRDPQAWLSAMLRRPVKY